MEYPASSHLPGDKNAREKTKQNDDDRQADFIGEMPPSLRMNSLREAMASADLRIALEDLEQDEPLQPGSREADRFAQSLEDELERSFDEAEADPQDAPFEQAIEKVNTDLRKACSEIAREAQVSLRIDQLVRERDRELRARHHVHDTDYPVDDDGPANDGDRQTPFAAALSQRRTLLFCVAAALAGAGSVLLGLPAITDTADRNPVAAISQDNQPVTASAGTMSNSRELPSIYSNQTQIVAKAVPEPQIETLPAPAATQTQPISKQAQPPSTTVVANEPVDRWQGSLADRLGPEAKKAAEVESVAEPVAEIETPPPSKNLSKTLAFASEEPISPAVNAVKEMARLTPGQTEQQTQQDPPKAPSLANEPQEGTRSLVAVELALAQTRGLDDLESTQREYLRDMLVEGKCLSEALGSIFVKVPVLVMRDLVSKLESEC